MYMYYTTIWWYLALGSGPCEHESQYSQRECRCYRVIPYYRVTQPFGWGALDRSCWTWCLPWTSWAASGIWFRSSSRSLPIWPLLSLTPYYGTPAAWCSRQWIPASQVWVLLRPFIIRERTCWWRPIRSDGPSPWSLRSPPRWRQLAMALTWSRQLEMMMMTVTAPLLLRSTTMKETMPQSWSHNLPAKRLTPVPAWPLLPRPGREATTKWRKTIGRLQATMTSFSWSHGLFPATMIGCKRILRSGKATRSTRGNPPLKSVLPWPIQWQLNRYWPLWVVWNLICCQRLSQRWRPQSVGPTNSQEELIWVSSEQWSNQEAFNSSVEPLDWSSASAATRTLIKVSWCSTFSIFGLLCLICLHSFQVFQVLGVYRVYMSLYTFQKISESFFWRFIVSFSPRSRESLSGPRDMAQPRGRRPWTTWCWGWSFSPAHGPCLVLAAECFLSEAQLKESAKKAKEGSEGRPGISWMVRRRDLSRFHGLWSLHGYQCEAWTSWCRCARTSGLSAEGQESRGCGSMPDHGPWSLQHPLLQVKRMGTGLPIRWHKGLRHYWVPGMGSSRMGKVLGQGQGLGFRFFTCS